MKKYNPENNIKMVLYRDYDITLEKTIVLTITIRKNGNTWRTILFDNIDENYICLLELYINMPEYNMLYNMPEYNIVLFDNLGNIGMYISKTINNKIIFENEFICKKINDTDILKEELEQLRDEIKQLRDETKQQRDEIKQLRDEIKQQRREIKQLRDEVISQPLDDTKTSILIKTKQKRDEFKQQLLSKKRYNSLYDSDEGF